MLPIRRTLSDTGTWDYLPVRTLLRNLRTKQALVCDGARWRCPGRDQVAVHRPRTVLRGEVRQLLAAAEVHRLEVRALGHGPQAVQ